MILLIIILKISAGLIACVVFLLGITAVLPWHFIVNEVNTEKKISGHLAIWGGLIRFNLAYPVNSGTVLAWFVKTSKRRIHQRKLSIKKGRQKDQRGRQFLKSGLNIHQQLPPGAWRNIRRSVEFEPLKGVLTLGFDNPAYTGAAYGIVYSLFPGPIGSDLNIEADFVTRKSHFKGHAGLKIYPGIIIFLAVKYGFKTLKLFRSEKTAIKEEPHD